MVNAIRQFAQLSMKSRHISDNCAKAICVCALCVVKLSKHTKCFNSHLNVILPASFEDET